MIVYAASSNPGKLKEFGLEPLPGLNSIPPPEENGATFEENASMKAVYYSKFTSEFVLAEDSGLEVEALDGAPGIYSARYSGPNASDFSNNELLLRALGDSDNRKARYVCVAVLAQTGRVVKLARGTVEGEIMRTPRGEHGFGYDPLFFYAPLGRCFGELTPDEKFEVSHRGKALRALLGSVR